ncbi:MAG: YeiH family protein, partial [Nitrospirota bacterium]|nr:YeiH family protein [Nitrospirota bacterium]
MAEKQGIDWSSLWKKEDWWGVWIGFLIIALVLVGLTVKIPKFKWITDGEFTSYTVKMTPAVEKLAKEAEGKGEVALKDSLVALKTSIDSKNRKAIGDAAKKVEDTAKTAKDEGLKKRAGKLGKDTKGHAGNLLTKVFSSENIKWIIYIGIGYLILSIIAMTLMGEKVGSYIFGYSIVFILAVLGLFIAGNYTVHEYGVSYVLWCLFLGLFVSNLIGTPEWLKVAVRTEFYIKSGLVILGSRILFGEIVKAGAYGLVQALLVVFVVWYFCFWFATKVMKVDDDFAAVLSSGVSICGVSAAIASAGAIKSDPKKLSYVISILLICSIPMIIGMPIIIKATGMSDVMGGAWIGGTIDNSGSVVAATEMVSDTAMKIGVIVKMSQNV